MSNFIKTWPAPGRLTIISIVAQVCWNKTWPCLVCETKREEEEKERENQGLLRYAAKIGQCCMNLVDWALIGFQLVLNLTTLDPTLQIGAMNLLKRNSLNLEK